MEPCYILPRFMRGDILRLYLIEREGRRIDKARAGRAVGEQVS